MTMDLTRGGAMRRWVIGRDGVKRWLDDGSPVDPACDRSACGDHSPPVRATTRTAKHWPRKTTPDPTEIER